MPDGRLGRRRRDRRHQLRHHSAIVAALFFVACGDDSNFNPDAISFPPGDPNGGSVAGTITTCLTDTHDGLMYVAAFAPDGGTLLTGIAMGAQTFPVHYQLDRIPSGPEVIRGLLDRPPYSQHPFLDPPGAEDAIGVYLNASSVLPVTVLPGAVKSRIDFFVTLRP
jgi:hypothetical protein